MAREGMAGDGGEIGFVGIGAHARGECADARHPDRTRPAAGDSDADENVFFPSRLLCSLLQNRIIDVAAQGIFSNGRIPETFCLNNRSGLLGKNYRN